MRIVQIEVVKKAIHEDLATAYGGRKIEACDAFKIGQVFYTVFGKPDGFCDWAWSDISRSAIALLTGGSFRSGIFNNLMKDDESMIACCTDGFRPVSFLLRRVDTRDILDLSAAQAPAPVEAYDSERWGEFSYSVTGLEAGKEYRLRLHFAELFFSHAGSRSFSVEANGRRILEGYDIIERAGGRFKAVIEEAPVAADAGGSIRLSFLKGAADNPKLSALEIMDGRGPSARRVIAINAGGSGVGGFVTDTLFEGGQASDRP